MNTILPKDSLIRCFDDGGEDHYLTHFSSKGPVGCENKLIFKMADDVLVVAKTWHLFHGFQSSIHCSCSNNQQLNKLNES